MIQTTFSVKPLLHKGSKRLAISFPINIELNKKIKSIGYKWSNSYKCFYTDYNKENYKVLQDFCKQNSITLNIEKVEKTLQTKSKEIGESKNVISPSTYIKSALINSNNKLSLSNQKALADYKQKLILKAYSKSTIKTYTNEFGVFLQTLGSVSASDLTKERLEDYFVYCSTTLKLSENTIHSRLNALKFYYEQVINQMKFNWEIPRPKRRLLLPKLLNEKELSRLFMALTNKKHKAMLFTAYSAGLRLSEIVNLKITDIDSNRMQIFIQQAKGKKDRYVNLSPMLLDILRKYIAEYKPRPKKYLFESEQTFEAYPARTLQQIFYNAKIKAGIGKNVGIHSLRHSFATHLLEKGTDIKYIKDILGHFDIKTTERYLHVTKKSLVNIISPLDDLLSKNEIEW